jgi:hypothetical protein
VKKEFKKRGRFKAFAIISGLTRNLTRIMLTMELIFF